MEIVFMGNSFNLLLLFFLFLKKLDTTHDLTRFKTQRFFIIFFFFFSFSPGIRGTRPKASNHRTQTELNLCRPRALQGGCRDRFCLVRHGIANDFRFANGFCFVNGFRFANEFGWGKRFWFHQQFRSCDVYGTTKSWFRGSSWCSWNLVVARLVGSAISDFSTFCGFIEPATCFKGRNK